METRQFKKLSMPHLRLFMAVLIQNETVFENFEGNLTVPHFSAEHFQLLYRVVLDHRVKNNRLPTEAEVYAAIETYYEEDNEIISDPAQAELEDFLNQAYDPDYYGEAPPSSKEMEEFAFKAGKRVLLEKLREDVSFELDNIPSIENLSSFFQNSAEQAEILAKSEYSKGPQLTFDPEWDKKDPEFIHTTGLEFFDKYMSGGAKAKEAYGLMAPYGTCKTTLAVMLWCLAAEQAYAETLREEFDSETDKIGLSFLVTYEAPLSNEIRHRALMYASGVHRESLERMGYDGLDALSDDPEAPLPYEKKKFSREISDGVFMPERKRVEQVIPYLNNHTVCLDFTGSDPKWPYAGTRGVKEIASRIALELRNRGENYYVKNVIIDYFGLLVDRDDTLGDRREEDHKLYQKQLGDIVRFVSVDFDCHTWVLHQLSGAANAILNPTKPMHHTDAKGSKSFGESLNFAFVVGNLNLDQLGQIHCTKRRRAKPQPPSIIKVEGEFNNVYSPDNYHVDNKGQIVDKETASTVGLASEGLADYGDLYDNTTTAQDLLLNNEGDDE
jgi:hypothetical protein